MKDFKQIAEDCLAGKLSGIFILQDGSEVNSNHLKKLNSSKHLICSYGLYGWYISDNGKAYGDTGYLYESSIKKFIPNMKKEQIKIDIPEGMEAVQEIVDGEIRIKFVEKKLTYNDIFKKLVYTNEEIQGCSSNNNSKSFYKKAEVIRKLTNIRNYLGKPESGKMGYCIIKNGDGKITITNVNETNPHFVIFKTAEHAKEAINLIGYDKLKYLFEIW
jgi:hypothetical protein